MSLSPLTHDAFLGGRLHLWQPQSGYRAGVDPVLLAASITATPGQSVLDVGCGVGAAAFCLGARVGGLDLSGLEIQPDYADLATSNAREAGLPFDVHIGDIQSPPDPIKQRSFDHVITNPPYFAATARTSSGKIGRDQAHMWDISPSDWVKLCLKRVKPKGRLHVIHRAEALGDLLSDLPQNWGAIDVCPIAPRAGRKAELVIVRGCKDARRQLHLLAPIIMHEGDKHLQDGDDYTPEISAVLRHGAALNIGNG